VQWLAARERPPHLVCMASTAPGLRFLDELPYQGGAFMMGFGLSWVNYVSGRSDQSIHAASADWDRIYAHRPLLTADSVFGRSMPLYRDFLLHPTMDEYWKRIQVTDADFARIALPVLHVTGWFDGDQPGAMLAWSGMRRQSPSRDEQYLVVGPWTHAATMLGGRDSLGGLGFGPESVIDTKELHLRFFDRYLKGTSPRFETPRARLFVSGANQWRDYDDYPPAGAVTRELYLSSGGRANSSRGDGTLVWSRPDEEPSDTFSYNPRTPVPSQGSNAGADVRSAQTRPDILVYTSEPLVDAVEAIGPAWVELFAATDARDTDFAARLSVVMGDGRALKLGPGPFGIIRARYRNGSDREELITPGDPIRYRIDLAHLGHRFGRGERIRLEITSSAAPAFNPNQNTGLPVATDTTWLVARQRIFHTRVRPSRLVLTTVPVGK
jgi:putative CocE/NonD family hydrolase